MSHIKLEDFLTCQIKWMLIFSSHGNQIELSVQCQVLEQFKVGQLISIDNFNNVHKHPGKKAPSP